MLHIVVIRKGCYDQDVERMVVDVNEQDKKEIQAKVDLHNAPSELPSEEHIKLEWERQSCVETSQELQNYLGI